MSEARYAKTRKGVEEIERLAEGGFIEAVAGAEQAAVPASAAERFIAAQRFMDQTVANEAGLKSFFIQMKLQKLGNVEDVRAFLPDYKAFMEKHAGPEAAKPFVAEVSRLLG